MGSEHFAAIFKARKRQRRRQAQLGEPEAWPVRVLSDEERVERLAEETRVLAGRNAAVAEHVRIGNKCGNCRILVRPELGDRAPIRRVQILGIAEADVVERRGVAGQAVIRRRVVVLHRVIHRPDLREPTYHFRKLRQMLTHDQARLARLDRLELAPNTLGCVGLHVECVNVRRAAELVQEDDVLCLGQARFE